MSSPTPLPFEIHLSAERGELQKVVKWLRKGGLANALCPLTVDDGRATAESLLHAASGYGHLAMVRELLKRGASVDLPSGLGSTALMAAAVYNRRHRTDVRRYLYGHKACVKALLRAKANTELLDNDDRTALRWAKDHRVTRASRSSSESTPRCRSLPQPRLPPHRTLASPWRALPPRCPSRSTSHSWASIGELQKVSSRRIPCSVSSCNSLPFRVSRARQAAEGGQVDSQGRAGRRALHYHNQ
jgi:hypothetical protein